MEFDINCVHVLIVVNYFVSKWTALLSPVPILKQIHVHKAIFIVLIFINVTPFRALLINKSSITAATDYVQVTMKSRSVQETDTNPSFGSQGCMKFFKGSFCSKTSLSLTEAFDVFQ